MKPPWRTQLNPPSIIKEFPRKDSKCPSHRPTRIEPRMPPIPICNINDQGKKGKKKLADEQMLLRWFWVIKTNECRRYLSTPKTPIQKMRAYLLLLLTASRPLVCLFPWSPLVPSCRTIGIRCSS